MAAEKCIGSTHSHVRICHRYSSASLIILCSSTVVLATTRSRKGLVSTLLTSLTFWATYGPSASLTVPEIVRIMVSAPMASASATLASTDWTVPTSPVPGPSATTTRTASSTALTAVMTDTSTPMPMNILLESESSPAKSEMMALIGYHLQATRRAFAMVLARANVPRHSWETIAASRIANTTAASTVTAASIILCHVASVETDTLASTAKTLPV